MSLEDGAAFPYKNGKIDVIICNNCFCRIPEEINRTQQVVQ